MRDDFPVPAKLLLAQRVALRCSNPQCRQPTSGPALSEYDTINVGVAAHITAASPGGPRYDPSLPATERKGARNGVWLCQNCAKLVDSDVDRYPASTLRDWKRAAEDSALQELESRLSLPVAELRSIARIEDKMPELFAEMRADLGQFPLRREIVLLKKAWIYNGKGNELVYYFEDHEELLSKMDVLAGNSLVQSITYNEVPRYFMSETLAEYLGAYAK